MFKSLKLSSIAGKALAKSLERIYCGLSLFCQYMLCTLLEMETETPEDYQHCSTERKNWPAILHQYQPTVQDRAAIRPGIWYYNGHMLLDTKNKPLLAWPSLPWTISTLVNGVMIECFTRSNLAMSFDDIVGRMPQTSSTRLKGNISMRATRFRHTEGLIAWSPRMGSEDIKNYIDLLLGADRIEANSTEDFPGLTLWERVGIQIVNYCKHANRARGGSKRKMEDIEARKNRYEKLWKEYHGKRKAVDIFDDDDEPTQYLLSMKPREFRDEDEEEQEAPTTPPLQIKKKARKSRASTSSKICSKQSEDDDSEVDVEIFRGSDKQIKTKAMSNQLGQSPLGGFPRYPSPSFMGAGAAGDTRSLHQHASSPLGPSLIDAPLRACSSASTPAKSYLSASESSRTGSARASFSEGTHRFLQYGLHQAGNFIDRLQQVSPTPSQATSARHRSESLRLPPILCKDSKDAPPDALRMQTTTEETAPADPLGPGITR